jgi:hypothetical protein
MPSLFSRIAIAVSVGMLGGYYTYWHLTAIEPTKLGFDFTWAWRGARALLAGQNPYIVIQPTGEFPFNSAFKYPLPVAVLALPVATLSAHAATGIFEGVSMALLAFALTRDGFWRLPILVSAPSVLTLAMGQWSLLLVAAALLPAVSWLICVKPTTGFASFVYRPRWSAVLGSIAAYAACLLFVPSWPMQWWRSMFSDPSTHWYVPAVSFGFGPLLLLAGLRWRTPEARMLLALAIAPQVQALYSGLPALLAARNFRQTTVLSVLSSFGYLGWLWYDWNVPVSSLKDPAHQAPWLMGSIYLPALVIVLLHPNEGWVPEWMELRTDRLPQWLQGRKPTA